MDSGDFGIEDSHEEPHFVAKNQGILDILELARKVGDAVPILIAGENGVGKRALAAKIHSLSARKERPFCLFDCASPDQKAFSVSLISADGGTLYLDEISRLSPELQQVILLFLKEGRIVRPDGTSVAMDARIIASTERDLESLCKGASFLPDLYYVLSGTVFSVPALRERLDEIDDFCALFLERYKKEVHKDFSGFSATARDVIHSYMWQGNIRELKNTVEHACILGEPPLIRANDLGLPFSAEEGLEHDANEAASNGDRTLRTALSDFKRAYLTRLLRENGWNQTKVAKILDVQRTYVSRLINELKIPNAR